MLLNFDNLISKYNLKISGVIHVGGHHGEEFKDYEKHGIKEGIVFEPDPLSYNILLKKLEGNNFLVINSALGNTTGTANVFRSSNEGMSNSLLKPEYHIIQYPQITFNETFKCNLDKLDNFDTKNFNFLNMDVQGYELEVLKGGTKTLEKIDYIMTEINRVHLYENGCLIEEIDNFLLTFNFKRVETSWEGNTWGDAFYIKEKK
jgi:FkbM family methyltransferase